MGQIKIDISQEVIQFLNKNGVYRTNTSNYDIKHHFKD